ncbi:MAG: glucose-6-phosphate isomerase family protein [Chloroflexota bacterium]
MFRADYSNGFLEGASIKESAKTLGDLAQVFANETARATLDPSTVVYRVQSHMPVGEGTAGGLFFGTSFVSPGTVDGEFFMTRGHYHARRNRAEYYWCYAGTGLLLLMDENRRWWAQEMTPGSVHPIPGRVAHRLINTGSQVFAVGACWPADAGHDYDTIAARGFSVRIFRGADGPEFRTAA